MGNSGASSTFCWKPGCFCNEERNVLEYEVIKQLDKFRCAKSPGINICLACFCVPTARAAYPPLGETQYLPSAAIFSLYLFGGDWYNNLIRPDMSLILFWEDGQLKHCCGRSPCACCDVKAPCVVPCEHWSCWTLDHWYLSWLY